MTIRVIVKNDEDRDCEIEVATVTPGVGNFRTEAKLKGGESQSFYVHVNQQLHIYETKN